MNLPFDLTEPFTVAQAAQAGITRNMLTGARYRRLFPGVYVAGDAPVSLPSLTGAALLAADCAEFVSHQTAAKLLGAAVADSAVIHLGTTAKHQSIVPGVHVHRFSTRPNLTTAAGLAVTAPAHTFVDLARVLDLVDAVALGDSLVHRGLTTPSQLTLLARARQGPGARAVRTAASYVRVGAQSPRESRLRMLPVLAGLPEPELQIEVIDRSGRRRFLDMGYRKWRVGIEYDGRHHVERAEQWEADILRREDVESESWHLISVTGRQLDAQPGQVLSRIVTAVQRAGMTVPPLRDTWRVCFPGYQSLIA
ncbi:hypothetical protein [Flexivirga meconopsidis]|uniref:hypothetical protein n=1 Tax=Flexivirga meconopsidis TaxID=2977121 RepID=UPI0022403CE5|nr:hypothetical protein [Flexivirga meconopsidis]